MQQNISVPDSANAITRYFAKVEQPTQQETLGEIVKEILMDGRNLNRKALCTKLLKRLERASDKEEERHYNQLISMLFD